EPVLGSEPPAVTSVTRRGAADPDARREPGPARPIRRRPRLPGSRAVVGALLMTLAAVGVLAAYAGAGEGPAGSLVVATRSIRAGETIDPGALVVVDAEVPGTTSARAFASVEEVAGRVALGPIGDGE